MGLEEKELSATTMSSSLPSKWVLASVLLAVLSLGLSGILKLLTSVLLILVGCLAVLYAVTASEAQEKCGEELSRSRQKWRSLKKAPQVQRPVSSLSSFLTGVPLIDEQLHLIISYLMRDYVHSWQGALTQTNDFPQQVQQALQFVVSALSAKVVQVDWIPFLTTR